MKCDRCGTIIEEGEDREHAGRVLCEDCYMDALSPARSCDPWAVHSAKSFEKHMGGSVPLTPIQVEILDTLEETGGIVRDALLDRFRGRLSPSDLDREFAALRHMERARGEKRGDRVFLVLW